MASRPRPTRGPAGGRPRGGRSAAAQQASAGNRMTIAVLVFAAVAAVFLLRLVYLQVIVSEHYSAMASESRTVSFTTTPRRGTIYDRNGIVLATSVEATTIYANPSEVEDAAYTAFRLAETLGGKASDYEKILRNDEATFAYVKRQATVEEGDAVRELKLPGVYFIADTRREYPNGSIGGQVVGYCNVDGEGITGLELQYDDILKGTPGTYSAERGNVAKGSTPIPGGVIEETPAVDGTDIMISLDIKMQNAVAQALASGVENLGTDEGSAVIMDAGTGEIYAICSLPYMDPSDMSNSKVGSDQLKPITQAFEPGSIFKTVSILSVLEGGTMTPESTLFCPATISADGYTISDSHERGDETYTLRQILDHSSNIGVSLAVQNAGFQAFYDDIVQYNLNERTGVDYPGEASGTLRPFENWGRIVGYNASFGQGLSVTPLQMVRFYGAVINDGVEGTPHFLISEPQTGERPEYASEDVVDNHAVLADLRSMLRTVVTDGTGKAAGIEGYEVAGKTSTAEIAEGGVYKKGVYNLCFTGYIDNSSSQLVCFVGANEVSGMAQVTQIFHDIMTTAIEQYNITPK